MSQKEAPVTGVAPICHGAGEMALSSFLGPMRLNGSDRGRRLRFALALGWAGAVASLTLTPARGEIRSTGLVIDLCLICGERGAADAILNAALFVPLGLIVGARRGALFALGTGVLFSTGIETTQLTLLGRHSNLGDVVWNGLGAAAGAVGVSAIRSWLQSPTPLVARWVVLGLPTLYLLAAGLLLEPVRTDARYFGQWTPVGDRYEQYRGQVTAASLNGQPIPQGAFPPGADPNRWLAEEWTVEASVVKGPAPRARTPIIRLYANTGILLLGADGEDLVWHERTRAMALGFDYSDAYLRGALAPYAVGDSINLGARRSNGDLCLWVDANEACGFGVAPARTWTLLVSRQRASEPSKALLDLFWMVTLFSPLGLVSQGARPTLASTAIAIALTFMITALTPMLALGWIEWVGIPLGVFAGVLVRPVVRLFVGLARGCAPSA